jgi:DEP domain-containing protein 5
VSQAAIPDTKKMASRTSSVGSAPNRRRSNTVTSFVSTHRNSPLTPASASPVPLTPARLGEKRVLTAWVHDPRESPDVIFNRAVWNAGPGSIVRVVPMEEDSSSGGEERAFMFAVPEGDVEGPIKYGLQVIYWLDVLKLAPCSSSPLL